MTRLLLATLLTASLLAPSTACAGGARAYETLRSAHIFSFGGVGITGKRTPEENAYDTLIRAPDAEQQFRRLLAEASSTAAGRLYALYGLRQLRVPDYWALNRPYRRDHTQVDTAFGCLVGRDEVCELLRTYVNRAYAIKWDLTDRSSRRRVGVLFRFQMTKTIEPAARLGIARRG